MIRASLCPTRHGWKGDAVLAVTLLNSEHGYKFDEYGASITVRRTIKQPSGGGYELLDHDGKVNVNGMVPNSLVNSLVSWQDFPSLLSSLGGWGGNGLRVFYALAVVQEGSTRCIMPFVWWHRV